MVPVLARTMSQPWAAPAGHLSPLQPRESFHLLQTLPPEGVVEPVMGLPRLLVLTCAGTGCALGNQREDPQRAGGER